MNSEVDEQWTVHSFIEYMSENFVGLILLVLAFFIIYFVDHINQLNAMIFDSSTSLPNMSSSQISLIIKPNSKKQKLKRR